MELSKSYDQARLPVFQVVRPSGLRSGFFSFLGMAVPFALYLLVTPILVSRLGDADYGLLALFLSIPIAFGAFDLGLTAGGILSIGGAWGARRVEAAERLQRELLSVSLFIGMISFGLLYYLSGDVVEWFGLNVAAGGGRAVHVLRLAGACLLISLLTEAASITPKALEQFPRINIIQISSKTALWLGSAGLVLRGGGLIAVAVWVLLLGAMALATYLFWTGHLFGSWQVHVPVLRIREVWSILPYSVFAFAGQLASAVTYHADKFLIAYFLGPAPVAYYAVAVGIASKLLVLAGSLAYFVFPRAATLHAAQDGEALRHLYLRASRVQLLAIFPVLLPAVMLAPSILRFWLGPEYGQKVSMPLQLLLVSYFIIALSVVPSYVYNGMGDSRTGAAYAAAGAAVNVICCLLLIPRMGIQGAAVAVLLGALQSILFMSSLESKLGLGWLQSQRPLFGRLLGIGVIQGLFLAWAGRWPSGWPSLLVVGLAGWAIFYALWFFVPSLASEDDRCLLSRIMPCASPS